MYHSIHNEINQIASTPAPAADATVQFIPAVWSRVQRSLRCEQLRRAGERLQCARRARNAELAALLESRWLAASA